jgi:hypothetical protein
MSGFELAVGGRLKLKGDAEPRKKKRRKEAGVDERAAGAAGADAAPGDAAVDGERPRFEPTDGTGLLQTSGTIVMGRGTRFTKDLAIDDCIVLTVVDRFRNTTADESRRVRMVVGETSASLEAPFSCDVTVAAPYRILKAEPDADALAAAAAAAAAERKRARSEAKHGEYVTYDTLKAGASASGATWKTTVRVTERLGPGRSREDLLDHRCKQKSDRYAK